MILRGVVEADTPFLSFALARGTRDERFGYYLWELWGRVPYSEKIFKGVNAQNSCPAWRHQWKGLGRVFHYLDKKQELEALERELEKREGFRVEFED